MNKFEIIRANVDIFKNGMEIAPWFNPILPKSKGYKTIIVDLFEKNKLVSNARERHCSDKEIENIEDVDIVGDVSNLLKITEGAVKSKSLNWIVSSHNFEHIPNPISFLNDCSSLLVGEGGLLMAIPDKRLCHDRFFPYTIVADMLQAYISPQLRGDDSWRRFKWKITSCHLEDSKIGKADSWSFSNNNAKNIYATNCIYEEYQNLLAELNNSALPKFTGHRWAFCPSSFKLCIEDLFQLGLINLKVTEIWETSGCEFVALLKPINDNKFSGEKYKKIRTNLLRNIEKEMVTASIIKEL